MNLTERVALEVLSGAPLILQRVGRGVGAEEFAGRLGSALQGAVRVATTWDDGRDVAVIDARMTPPEVFAGWDARRPTLVPAGACRVLLLDAASAAMLLSRAPHLGSWAGGVCLPEPDLVRPARTEEELRIGGRLFDEWVRRGGRRGERVGIDLQTGRAFTRTSDGSVFDVAREHLDEGVIFVGQPR
jgi:hypothetical protein